MKRKGYLFEQIISLENIYQAETLAKKNKKKKKDVINHNKNREHNILTLREQFINKSYKTSEYYEIYTSHDGILALKHIKNYDSVGREEYEIFGFKSGINIRDIKEKLFGDANFKIKCSLFNHIPKK